MVSVFPFEVPCTWPGNIQGATGKDVNQNWVSFRRQSAKDQTLPSIFIGLAIWESESFALFLHDRKSLDLLLKQRQSCNTLINSGKTFLFFNVVEMT